MSNEEPAEAEAQEEAAVEEDGEAGNGDVDAEETVAPDAETDDEGRATGEETTETTEDGEDSGGAEEGEAEEDAEDGETEEGEEPEGIQEGDFVRVAYTARTVENETLVDTTDLEVAEEEGVDAEGQNIEPRVIVVGAGHLFPAVEQDLIGKDVGEEGSVTVPAAEAFGEYDSDQVRTISADRIPEDDRHPGGHVDIDGQHGHVETIIGGRARVDFNHLLAGEDVEYDYEILDVVEDRLEQARGLLGMYVDIDLDVHVETDEVEQTVYEDEEEGTETVEQETLYVEATPQLSMNQQWLFQKTQIAQELIDRTGVDRVIVQEVLDGTSGLGGLGGLGGAGLQDLDADLEDVDAEELVEELEEETDLEIDTDDAEE